MYIHTSPSMDAATGKAGQDKALSGESARRLTGVGAVKALTRNHDSLADDYSRNGLPSHLLDKRKRAVCDDVCGCLPGLSTRERCDWLVWRSYINPFP